MYKQLSTRTVYYKEYYKIDNYGNLIYFFNKIRIRIRTNSNKIYSLRNMDSYINNKLFILDHFAKCEYKVERSSFVLNSNGIK